MDRAVTSWILQNMLSIVRRYRRNRVILFVEVYIYVALYIN